MQFVTNIFYNNYRTAFMLFVLATIVACQQQPNREIKEVDTRPDSQVSFMKKVDSLQKNILMEVNSAKVDMEADEFTQFVKDSLKNIKNWQFIVSEINDDTYKANSFAKGMFNLADNPIYNLTVCSVIKQHEKNDSNVPVDSFAININPVDADVVYFTYTIPKDPKNKNLKDQIDLIRKLTLGDTVLMSGAVTHIDKNLKIDLSEILKQYSDWNLDLLATDIKRK